MNIRYPLYEGVYRILTNTNTNSRIVTGFFDKKYFTSFIITCL